MDKLELSAILKDDISPILKGISARIDEMDKKFKQSDKTMQNSTKSVKSGAKTQYDSLTQLAGGIGVAALAYKGFGVAMDAIAQAGKWEKLQKGLNAMEGGVVAGNKAMERMVELSKMPGLGLEEVNRAYLNLRAVGLQAGESERMIKAFGNAVANAGGGAEEFGRVQKQLAQMLSKGRVLQEDISVISESMPGISEMMQKAFGTRNVEAIRNMGVGADEFVSKITAMAEQLPQATTTVTDAMDDLSTSWSRFKASFVNTEWTKSVIGGISTALNDLTTLFTQADARLNKSEIFKAWLKGGGLIGFGGGMNVLKGLTTGKFVMTGKEGRQADLDELKAKYEKTSDYKQAQIYAKEIKELERQIQMEAAVERNSKRLEEQATKARIAQGKAAAKTVTKKAGSVRSRDKEEVGIPQFENMYDMGSWNAEQDSAYKSRYREEDATLLNEKYAKAPIEAQKAKMEEYAQQMQDIQDQYIQSMASNMEGVFADAFANIGKKGHDLWSDLFEGFKQMLVQMAAEMAAKAVVFGLFSLFTGGAGAAGVGAGGTFLKTILGASTGGGAVPSLSPVASAGAGVNLTVNLSGGATKKDAVTIANTLAAAQRGRLASVVA